MNRRRFFPAQMTQTEPGKVVDLEVQLRPEAVVPAPAEAPASGECEVFGVGWLSGISGSDVGANELPDGRWELVGSLGYGFNGTAIWGGAPEVFSPWGVPLDGPTFRCTEIITENMALGGTVLVGVMQAHGLTSPSWSIAWSHSDPVTPNDSLGGHRVVARGNMLWVWVKSFDWGAAPTWDEILYARAFCNGVPAGTLRLELYSNG